MEAMQYMLYCTGNTSLFARGKTHYYTDSKHRQEVSYLTEFTTTIYFKYSNKIVQNAFNVHYDVNFIWIHY